LKYPSLKSHALGLAAMAMMVVGARAAEPDANPPVLISQFSLTLVSPPPEPVLFWQRFDFSFEKKANGIFADALQPLNVIRWNVDLRGRDFSDNFRELASSRARGAFLRTAEYGARDAAMEMPLMFWLDDHQSWFANLLRGTVDNTSEEASKPLDASREGFEQARWRDEANRGPHYGIRPLRTSPYAYVSQAISDGERTLLLAHLRYYYEHFAHHRVEFALSVPLEYAVSFNVGSSYEFDSHNQQRLAVKLVKELKGGGIGFAGFEVREHPALIAGITLGW
jgi:hypothetical protein